MSNFSIAASVLAILYSAWQLNYLKRKCSFGTDEMHAYSRNVRRAEFSQLLREYRNALPFVCVLFLLLFIFLAHQTAWLFLTGAVTAGFLESLVCYVITAGESRTAAAAAAGEGQEMKVALRACAAVGMAMAGLVIGIGTIIYKISSTTVLTEDLAGFGLGFMTIAIYVRPDGKLYNRSFDIMGSMLTALIASMTLSGEAVYDLGVSATFSQRMACVFPIFLAGAGLLVSWILQFFIRGDSWEELKRSTLRLSGIMTLVMAVISVAGCWYFLLHPEYAAAPILGLAAAYLATQIELRARVKLAALRTTRKREKRRRKETEEKIGIKIQKTEEQKLPKGILTMSDSLISLVMIAVLFGVSYFLSWYFAGTYGIALAACGSVSLGSLFLIADSFEPVMKGSRSLLKSTSADPDESALDRLSSHGKTPLSAFSAMATSLSVAAVMDALTAVAKGGEGNMNMSSVLFVILFAGAAVTLLFSAWYLRNIHNTVMRVLSGVFAVALPVCVGLLVGAPGLIAMIAGMLLMTCFQSVVFARSGAGPAVLVGSRMNLLLKMVALCSLGLMPLLEEIMGLAG